MNFFTIGQLFPNPVSSPCIVVDNFLLIMFQVYCYFGFDRNLLYIIKNYLSVS